MRITSSILVPRPADVLFELSQNYARRCEWDTYLCEAYLLGGATHAAIGVEAHCKNKAGEIMISRYISCSPPRVAAVQMVSGPKALRRFSGTWRFHDTGDGMTEVKFIYSFTLQYWLLPWVMDPLVALFYRRDIDRRIRAFKRWAENVA
jgi:ribosome-associated toxin RatA of RatAB toxin-antitoxin module